MDENPSLLTSSLPVFLDRDEEAKAESWCSQALGQAPDLEGQARADLLRVAAAAGLLALGDERLRAGLVGGAASSCIKAVALAPGFVDGWLLLVRVHRASGALEQARGCLERAAQLVGDVGGDRICRAWREQIAQLRLELAPS
jgi:tetratricopeptide (TPR) repeat protein